MLSDLQDILQWSLFLGIVGPSECDETFVLLEPFAFRETGFISWPALCGRVVL